VFIAPLLNAPVSAISDAQLDAIIAQLVAVILSLRRCGTRHEAMIAEVYEDMSRYSDERERRRKR
jgi:hypothetical protein